MSQGNAKYTVTVTSSALPTGAATSLTEFAEDAAHTTGDKGSFVLAVRNTGNAALTNADGDYSPIGVDDRGNVGITPRTASTSLGDGGSNTQNLQTNNAGTAFVILSYNEYYNGSTWDRMRGNTSGLFTQGPKGTGTALGGNPVLMGVSDGTNVRNAAGDTSGNMSAALVPTATAVGLTRFRNVALTNTAVVVKASAGNIYSLNAYNPGATLAYLHIYNVAAASVTVGTTVPDWSIALPATATGTVGLDQISALPYFTASGAFSVSATTTPNGGTAPGTALVVNLGYV